MSRLPSVGVFMGMSLFLIVSGLRLREAFACDTYAACLSEINTYDGGAAIYGQSVNGQAVSGLDLGTGQAIFGSASYGQGVEGVATAGIGVLGIETTGSDSPPAVSAGVVGSGSGTSVYGGYFISSATHGVYGVGSTGAYSGVFGTSSSTSSGGGSGVAGTNTSSGYGGYFTSTSGIALYGLASGSEAIEGAYTGTGASNGVKGTSSSSSSTSAGVYGDNTGSGYGVHGASSNGSGVAVYGANAATSGYAVGGAFNSSYGIGLEGTTATSAAGFGAGIYGSGSRFGVWGQPSGGFTGAVGVYGTDNGTNSSYGVEAVVSGAGSIALYADGPTQLTGQVTVTGPTQLTGQVTVTGSGTYSGTWTPVSDGRLKKDIATVTDGLADVVRLRPVTYKWREPSKHGNYTATRYGFIAQEVEKVHPEWVQTDADGFKSLDLDQFEAVEVGAIQTLKAENDDLKKENKAMKTGLSDLKDRLDSWENTGHWPTAGFRFPTGNAGYGLAGILFGFIVADKLRKKTNS